MIQVVGVFCSHEDTKTRRGEGDSGTLGPVWSGDRRWCGVGIGNADDMMLARPVWCGCAGGFVSGGLKARNVIARGTAPGNDTKHSTSPEGA